MRRVSWQSNPPGRGQSPDLRAGAGTNGVVNRFNFARLHRGVSGTSFGRSQQVAANAGPRGHPAPGFFLCTRVVTATKPRIGDPRGGCGPRERRHYRNGVSLTEKKRENGLDRRPPAGSGPQGRETAYCRSQRIAGTAWSADLRPVLPVGASTLPGGQRTTHRHSAQSSGRQGNADLRPVLPVGAGTAARRAANHTSPLSAIVQPARERRPPVGTLPGGQRTTYRHSAQSSRMHAAARLPSPAGAGPTERTPMHLGFLGCGTGSARAAADYLVGERDAAGRVRVARRRERRAAYHRGRYGGDGRTGARTAAERLAAAPGGRPEPFSRVQRRELGADALVVGAHPDADRDPGGAE